MDNTWILWKTQFVLHVLQSFHSEMVRALGNMSLSPHPGVIMEVETAVAHSQLKAGWRRPRTSACNHWTQKVPLFKLSAELITQKPDSGQSVRNLDLVLLLCRRARFFLSPYIT